MKKFLYIILAILLCIGIGGGAYVLAKDLNPNTNIEQPNDDSSDESGDKTPNVDDPGNQTPDSGNSGGGNNNGGSNGGDNNVDEEPSKELIAAPNEASLKEDKMHMVSGAQIYLGEEEYEPAIRFTFTLTSALKAEVDGDANKHFAFLVAPVEYFDSVNPNNYTYMDWMNEFNKAGKTVIYSQLEESNFVENGSDYIVRFRLQNVFYKNMNRNFVCMLVVATENGDSTSYKYNAYDDNVTYRSNARSVSYVAAASLNAHALGMETFTDDNLARLKGYINQAVDLANGLEEPTDDGSKVILSVSPTGPKTVSVGQTFKVEATYSPESINLPIWYRSTDTSILTVDDQGNVKALKAGTAVIGVYVAGETFGITVTVS